ncbi:hypothetical protein B0H17DRAFT_1144756 [Mycena rosella]|uniref:Uncharacterized protein n=1 Tax=Mycena rosella TaxID=1033263 RepID=A0AAD7CTE4_MYCRO|nr:hypothetical protein B0H17DRAFT_1144756 [Mycena rosella]
MPCDESQTARQGQIVIVPQFCTLPLGGGLYTRLNGTTYTNTPGIQSPILISDADCAAFPSPDCQFIDSGKPVLEQFSDDSQHLEGKGIQSVQCFENVGTTDSYILRESDYVAISPKLLWLSGV